MTRLDAQVVIAAHRGMAVGYPENTLTAFRHSVVAGFPVIEVDLRATADGRIVIMHDADLAGRHRRLSICWHAEVPHPAGSGRGGGVLCPAVGAAAVGRAGRAGRAAAEGAGRPGAVAADVAGGVPSGRRDLRV
ncbi:MAG TPA: glycerophosphodiester phosphodiesterase family protein [Streptosporangiaceae bacterium]